jgi:hypothetical protein
MAADPEEQRQSIEPDRPVAGRPGRGSAVERIGGLRIPEPLRSRLTRFLGFLAAEPVSDGGAERQRATGWWLGRLPTGWHVFNDVPVGEAGTSLDHLVIGPGGVFTINTKVLDGKIWLGPHSVLLNRRRTDFLPRASAEAERASELLSAALGRPVVVRAALAILADDWTIRRRPIDVYVDATRGVRDWVLRQPAVLRPQDVAELSTVASRPATWRQAHLDPPGEGA